MSLRNRFARFLDRILPRRRKKLEEVERVKRVVRMVGATEDHEIACDEAYRLLDQYADTILRGEDPAAIFPQLKHHLEMCMDCREELEALLEALRPEA